MENKSWAIRNGFKGVYREFLAIRLPFEVKRSLEKKAKEKGLKVSDLVRVYIEKGLASESKSEAIG
jgi:predicted DNA-binding protein